MKVPLLFGCNCIMNKPTEPNIIKACLAMVVSLEVAKLSPDPRKGVGATIFRTKSGLITSYSFNSKPTHSANFHSCINEKTGMSQEDLGHAEVKAIVLGGLKQRTSRGNDSISATSAPCVRCAGYIALSKMNHVYYLDPHDDLEGVRVLKEDYGIECTDLTPWLEYIHSLSDRAILTIESLGVPE